MAQLFYVDTCIWLNLFKKELQSVNGLPCWQVAKRFIEGVLFSHDSRIVYSGFVLRELQFKLSSSAYADKAAFLKSECTFITARKEDYALARQLESESGFSISFYDCLHVAICKRIGAIVVTRDSRLLVLAKKCIAADAPENLPA